MTVVCIAGMHRTGTSMVARMLNLCGVYLGKEKDLIPSEKDNPEGFWENMNFVIINNNILHSLKAGWDIIPADLQPGWERSSLFDQYRKNAIELINEMSMHDPWGWKDPRNSLTFPFWQQLIPDVKIVICVRNPIEVGNSLAKRGYSSKIFSDRLWYTYYEKLLASVNPDNFIITHYDTYFFDCKAELRRLLSFLDMHKDKKKINMAANSIKSNLKHCQAEWTDHSDFKPSPEITEMYNRLCAQAGSIFQLSFLNKTYNIKRKSLHQTIDFMGNQLQYKDKMIASLQHRLVQSAADKDQALQDHVETKNELLDAQSKLEILEIKLQDHVETKNELLAAKSKLEMVNEKLQEHIDWIANRDQLINELRWQLERIHKSVGRKILYPFIFIPKFFKNKSIKAYRVWRDEGATSALRNTYNALKITYFKNKSIKVYRVVRDEGTASALRNTYKAFKIPLRRKHKPVQVDLHSKNLNTSQRSNKVSIESPIKVIADDSNFKTESLKIASSDVIASGQKRARLIAFYLPQYHPIPENDEWWGKGFTEWTNVARAKPIFAGHQQPNFPYDLGFYDLRIPESRIEQAELARQYGIEGFCYWHYWFAGKRLLERPLNEVLESGKPDFPFCLAWANHTWSGIWHGCPDQVLIEQTYPGKRDFIDHFYALIEAFKDPRYIKIDKRNIFCIYRPFDLKKAKIFMDIWRELALKEGMPGFYFIAITDYPWKMPKDGYDAYTTNPPVGMLPYQGVKPLNEEIELAFPNEKKELPTIYSYETFMKYAFPKKTRREEFYPCVLPNWDNTPRSGANGFVLHGSTPDLYGEHLREAIGLVKNRIPEQKVVFIKSWNEWAETNYLEPDMKWGRAYLEKTLSVITKPEVLKKFS